MNTLKEYRSKRLIYSEEYGQKNKLPANIAMKIARENSQEDYKEGGFGCACEKCNKKYGQSFLVFVYLGFPKGEGYVCKDCYKMFHYQKA